MDHNLEDGQRPFAAGLAACDRYAAYGNSLAAYVGVDPPIDRARERCTATAVVRSRSSTLYVVEDQQSDPDPAIYAREVRFVVDRVDRSLGVSATRLAMFNDLGSPLAFEAFAREGVTVRSISAPWMNRLHVRRVADMASAGQLRVCGDLHSLVRRLNDYEFGGRDNPSISALVAAVLALTTPPERPQPART